MESLKTKAFISSNLKEFGPEDNLQSTRRKVAKVLEDNSIEAVMWETLQKPDAMTPRQFYLQYLQECQIYLGMIGLKESEPTADEYRLAKQLALERWIFVRETLPGETRHSQMQELADSARSELVYHKFTSEETLLEDLRSKARFFLSEKVAEYIELRKRRAHEFWSVYVRDFLEPLLTELKTVIRELDNDASFGGISTGSWRSIKDRPMVNLDSKVGSPVGVAYEQLEIYQNCWGRAYQVFDQIVASALEWNLLTPLSPKKGSQEEGLVKAAIGDCRAIINSNSSQLMFVAVLPLEDRKERLGRFSVELYRKIEERVYQLKSSLEGYPRGLGHDYDVRLIDKIITDASVTKEFSALSASLRSAREKTKQAYDVLWSKFVELVGE